jgi:hypothetical protein
MSSLRVEGTEQSLATFSSDSLYRYHLSRRWAPGPRALFCMLNPSVASSDRDDPTIRRCIGFAKCWNMGGIIVVNLFAMVSTDPKLLRTCADDPVGPHNDATWSAWLDTIMQHPANKVVLAWGAQPVPQKAEQAALFLNRCDMRGLKPACLGRSKITADPRHPLMLSYETKLERYA